MDGVYSYCAGLLHIAASAKSIRDLSDGNHVLDLCTSPPVLDGRQSLGYVSTPRPIADKAGRVRSRRLRAISACVLISLPVF